MGFLGSVLLGSFAMLSLEKLQDDRLASDRLQEISARLITEMSDVVLHKAEMHETQEQKEQRIELAHQQQVHKEELESKITSSIVEEDGERIEEVLMPEIRYEVTEEEREVRTRLNNIEYFSPNFEGLVLGCIDADFCN